MATEIKLLKNHLLLVEAVQGTIKDGWNTVVVKQIGEEVTKYKVGDVLLFSSNNLQPLVIDGETQFKMYYATEDTARAQQ